MERRKIREIIIKALYRMDIGGDNPVEIVENFTKRAKISAENKELGLKWIKKIIQKKEEIDEIIERIAKNWSLNRIAIIDKQILRLGICELLWFKDIPFRVSINEAVELAKKYSEEEGYKFVNGILDKVAKDENRNNK